MSHHTVDLPHQLLRDHDVSSFVVHLDNGLRTLTRPTIMLTAYVTNVKRRNLDRCFPVI